jgi:hypothetical protein
MQLTVMIKLCTDEASGITGLQDDELNYALGYPIFIYLKLKAMPL